MSQTPRNFQKPDPEKKCGDFNCGDTDPTTGRTIIYICYQTPMFLVTIDETFCLNWFAENDITYAPDFGEIASQVSLAEALVDRIFVGRTNKMAYKKLLGDVLATLLDDGKSDTARDILKEVKERILLHSKERIRMAYINYAIIGVIMAGVFTLCMILFKDRILEFTGDKNIYRVALCTFLGGIGAFVSTFSRFKDYQGSIIAGLPIHRLDGFLRVFYGLVAGVIIAFAIKSQVFAGFAGGDQPWLLYFFAMIAGASEVLIPNLVKEAEKKDLNKAKPGGDGEDAKKDVPDPGKATDTDNTAKTDKQENAAENDAAGKNGKQEEEQPPVQQEIPAPVKEDAAAAAENAATTDAVSTQKMD